MATEAKLRQLADRGCPVYYFYSSERYLVRQAVSAAVRILSADTDEETTVLDGAAPEIEQLIMAAVSAFLYRFFTVYYSCGDNFIYAFAAVA